MRAGLAVVAAALAAAPALAHATIEDTSQSAVLGGWYVFFQTVPGTVYAGGPFTAALSVNAQNFSRAEGLDVRLRGPDGPIAVREGPPGRYEATIDPVPGRLPLVYDLPDANGTHRVAWNLTLDVYREVGVRYAAAEELEDYYANETKAFGVEILNTTTLRPDPRVTDARFRFEHWTDDHTTKLSEDVVEAARDGDAWWATYGFPQAGMYHIRVASRSLGTTFEDTPYLHVYAVEGERPAPREETKETPVGAVAVLALAAAAVALARRPRG